MADAIAHGQGPGAGKEDPAGLGARSTAPFCVSASVMGKKIYILMLQDTVLLPTHIFVRSSAGTLHFPIYKNLQNSKIRISLRERKDRGRHTEGCQGRT